jgi:hypothetical protein
VLKQTFNEVSGRKNFRAIMSAVQRKVQGTKSNREGSEINSARYSKKGKPEHKRFPQQVIDRTSPEFQRK